MKIAIVDDEKIWREKAYVFTQKYFQGTDISITLFESGDALLKNNREYDILILDVEMPGKDGFQTALEYKKIYPETIVIMFTTHLEMSRKGYVVEAFRYVHKTKMNVELKEAFHSSKKLLKRNKAIYIHVINVGRIPIMLKNIISIETNLRKVIVHTYDNEYECSDTISSFEKNLPQEIFYRCHKSYIVNLDAVKKVEDLTAYMIDGSKVMIGIKKSSMFKKKYMERKYECINM